MKFSEFLEITYVEKNLKLQANYDLKLQAETKACHELIGIQRNWFRRLALIKLTVAFLWASFTKKFPKMPEFPIDKKETEPKEPINNVLPIQTADIQGSPISVV